MCVDDDVFCMVVEGEVMNDVVEIVGGVCEVIGCMDLLGVYLL